LNLPATAREMMDYFDGSSLLTCNFALVYYVVVMMMTSMGAGSIASTLDMAIEKSCEKSWQSEQ
jgi:hypothetical protein